MVKLAIELHERNRSLLVVQVIPYRSFFPLTTGAGECHNALSQRGRVKMKEVHQDDHHNPVCLAA